MGETLFIIFFSCVQVDRARSTHNAVAGSVITLGENSDKVSVWSVGRTGLILDTQVPGLITPPPRFFCTLDLPHTISIDHRQA